MIRIMKTFALCLFLVSVSSLMAQIPSEITLDEYQVQQLENNENEPQESQDIDEDARIQRLARESHDRIEMERKNLRQMTEASVDKLIESIESRSTSELNILEEAELNKTIIKVIRLQMALRYAQKFGKQAVEGPKVAILGESSSEFIDEGFNPKILGDLLQKIKKQNPVAVFFLGNSVYTLLNDGFKELNPSENMVELPPEKNIFGQILNQDVGIYSSESFKKGLALFDEIVKENLGNEIPFYPILGEQESLGPDSVGIFRDQFALKNAVILDDTQLVYTVPIDDSLFIVIATNYYDKTQKVPVENQTSPAVLNWLENIIKTEGSKYRHLFVLGNQPAYSTTASFGIYNGLDANKEDRNKFWDILIRGNILAYFSSNEVLYDRSYRHGVWQIISGGAGTPHDYHISSDDTFYHYLLMTLPSRQNQQPKIQVYNLADQIQDEWVVFKKPTELFELRISKSN